MSGAGLLVPVAVLAFLAFANGANDNGKGVATLIGSGALGERRSLFLALLSTLAGSLAAALLAPGLLRSFGGQGLVPDALAGDPSLLLCAGSGAAAAVLLACRFGLPVSTTHALLGALLGAGLVLSGGEISARGLAARFVVPLVASPLLAGIAVLVVHPAVVRLARFSAAGKGSSSSDPCLCIGGLQPVPVGGPVRLGTAALAPAVRVSRVSECASGFPPGGLVLPLARARASLPRVLHMASGAALSFARGLNDAPKIAAIGVGAARFDGVPAVALVGTAMALGGWLAARRVTRTMSHRITPLREEEGLAASLSSAALVLGASPLGLPVSTTHVTCGALVGVGLREGRARFEVLGRIAAAWAATLPLAAACAAISAGAVLLFHGGRPPQ
ncbi:MAG: inorganic phosphate transporter [Planctomycetes bacterium]|nr:inorganic phosphate transporter [Planctomycetota bacterium]